MLTMAVGHSDDVDPEDAIAVAIDECRTSLRGRSPQAGILLSTFESFGPALPRAVQDAFPGINVIGSTSAGEISSVNGFQEDSVVLAVFAADGIDVTAGLGTGLEHDVVASCSTAVEQALAGTALEPKLCILLTDPMTVDPQFILDAMERVLPKGVAVIGGAAAGNNLSNPRPTYQFCNDAIASDGVAILLLSGPLAYSTAVGTGWKTIGARGTVTSAQYGAIQAIDGRPALEFISKYIDVTGPASFGNPLAVFEDGTKEFYLRTIMPSDNAKGAIMVMGSVPEGAGVQLTTADTDQIIAGTQSALRQAKERFPKNALPQGALIFSCAVRKFMLGSKTGLEAELARSTLGADFPVCGLYCFGEVGPVEGAASSRFLNETFVTLLLGA